MDSEARHDDVGRLLTLADAAELLSLSAAQVLDLIRDGEITALRTGPRGRWRIEPDMLDAFIEDQYEQRRRIDELAGLRATPLPEIGGGRILR